MEAVESHLAEDAVVVMDDIQDNLFFRERFAVDGKPWTVFSFEGKYLGLAGPVAARA